MKDIWKLSAIIKGCSVPFEKTLKFSENSSNFFKKVLKFFTKTSNPQLSSSASFLRLNVLSSLN